MKELSSARTIQAIDVIRRSTQETLPTDDILYTSPFYFEAGFKESSDKPFKLIVSPQGQRLIEENPQLLLSLLDDPTKGKGLFRRRIKRVYLYDGERSVVARETIQGRKSFDVALKCVHDLDVTGIEQFQAMRRLQEEGAPVAMPFLATKHRLVTKWIDQLNASDPSARVQFGPYLQALKQTADKLKAEGKWSLDWYVEEQPDNYAVLNFQAENPLERFTAIDPIYRYAVNALQNNY